jgi:hypothetical protein
MGSTGDGTALRQALKEDVDELHLSRVDNELDNAIREGEERAISIQLYRNIEQAVQSNGEFSEATETRLGRVLNREKYNGHHRWWIVFHALGAIFSEQNRTEDAVGENHHACLIARAILNKKPLLSFESQDSKRLSYSAQIRLAPFLIAAEYGAVHLFKSMVQLAKDAFRDDREGFFKAISAGQDSAFTMSASQHIVKKEGGRDGATQRWFPICQLLIKEDHRVASDNVAMENALDQIKKTRQTGSANYLISAIEIVHLILENRQESRTDGNFRRAVETGSPELVQTFLKYPAKIQVTPSIINIIAKNDLTEIWALEAVKTITKALVAEELLRVKRIADQLETVFENRGRKYMKSELDQKVAERVFVNNPNAEVLEILHHAVRFQCRAIVKDLVTDVPQLLRQQDRKCKFALWHNNDLAMEQDFLGRRIRTKDINAQRKENTLWYQIRDDLVLGILRSRDIKLSDALDIFLESEGKCISKLDRRD